MAKDLIVITDAGLAEVVNAEQNGLGPVIISEVGYGTGKYTPTGDMTALKEEFKRLNTISGGAVGDNVVHLTARDTSADTYTVYEVGLYTESGKLFAVYSTTEPIIQKAPKAQSLLSIDIVVENFSPDSIAFGDTNFFNPPATTTTLGIVELATDSEVAEGTDATRVVTAKTLTARTATTSRTGLVELATAAEVLAGKDTSRAITPSTLLAAFVKSQDETGFQKLPNGLILQWGRARVVSDGGTNIALPVAFPTMCVFANALAASTLAVDFSVVSMLAGNITFRHNANGVVPCVWMALGY